MRAGRWWIAAAAAAGGAAGVLLAVPADAQEEYLDYKAVREAIPKMRELSTRGSEFGLELHKIMDAMEQTRDEATLRQLRSDLRQRLGEYRALKVEQMATIRPLLRMPAGELSDEAVLRKLRDTELMSVVWTDANFDKTIRDLSAALGIPIRLQFRVVQKNKVSIGFQKAPAETILATLCNGFDLRYVIHGGEIVIYKKITPTEERFIKYQEKHPEVKLKYWEREDASGHVDTKGGGK